MRTIAWLCAALAASVAARECAAGVMIREKISSEGFKGIGAFESSVTREIEGLKSRDQSKTRFTGAILKHFSGKGGTDSVTITRVDLDKRWLIDPAERTYVESSVSTPPKEETAPSERTEGEKEPTHRVKKVDFEVKRTGEKKTINGFDTERYASTLTVEVEDLKTRETSTFRLLSDLWTTPWTADLRKVRDEQREFSAAYAKKLGFSLSPAESKAMSADQVALLLGADREQARKTLAKYRRELAKLDGYPIVTESNWFVAGSGRKAAAPEESESAPSLSGGPSGLASSFLGGLARKKLREKAAEREGKPQLSTRVEVEEVARKDLPKDDFEIPAGYRKKQP